MNPGLWMWLGAAVLAALMIKPVQDRVHGRLELRGPDSDILYFASPAVLKKMALGYDGVLADIYWMRTIQYYGRRDEADRRPVRYKNLAALLDLTSALDPDMVDVYRAGSVFLAEPDPSGAGQPDEAVKLLDRGIEHHPQDWRLMMDKGFIYFWYVRDFKRAGDIWLSASRLSAAPHWMEALAAMALSRGGDVETAKLLWQHQLEQSDREDVKENARNHLFSLEVAEARWTLEFFIERYREKHGRLPEELEDLVRAGFLRQVPKDPSGAAYAYEPANGFVGLSPETGVRYLSVPQEYRDSFRQRLARSYGGR
jgi:tetratricopeptide (TPR) repeat protein